VVDRGRGKSIQGKKAHKTYMRERASGKVSRLISLFV
jgi:hypothetical protein